jgi:hypothetical protein
MKPTFDNLPALTNELINRVATLEALLAQFLDKRGAILVKICNSGLRIPHTLIAL